MARCALINWTELYIIISAHTIFSIIIYQYSLLLLDDELMLFYAKKLNLCAPSHGPVLQYVCVIPVNTEHIMIAFYPLSETVTS